MLPVASPRYDKALRHYIEITPRLEWADDWVGWRELPVVSGSVTADRTSQVRYSGQFTISDPGRDALLPYGARVRLAIRARILRSDPFDIPMGLYRVDSVNRDEVAASAQLDASGLEIECQESQFVQPRKLPDNRGQTIRLAVERLIREAVNDAQFEWRITGADRPFSDITEETDRWGIIDGQSDSPSFAKALGAEIYSDARGVFVIDAVPTLSDAPVWLVNRGDDGVLIQPIESLSRVGVANLIAAVGTRDDGSPPIGPGYAWDTLSYSPTYAGTDPIRHPERASRFGVKPLVYQSPLLEDIGMCVSAADALLQDNLGLRQAVTFTSVVNPALEPGDVVQIELAPDIFENHLLDTWTYELGAGTMSCVTRTLGVGSDG